ncbi:DUF2971 domain-containing protein [Marinobacter sp. NFXS9]|uniref:DUF2971 domain-containing protein n=1 Tax=Marinobacter sp. NFXS9 TaxID=2818433 RepID=UPI0032DF6967
MAEEYPEYLYKFRSGSKRDIENLRNGNIWLPKFEDMNDPHDGQLDILIDQAIRMHGVHTPMVIHDASGSPAFIPFGLGTTEHENRHSPEVEEKYRKEAEKAKQFYGNVGVYSLSESCGSPQMWAHYASESSGFCIEYKLRTDSGDLHQNCEYFFRVRYVDDYPEVDLRLLSLSTEGRRLFEMFGRKERNWSYEKEWRFVSPEGGFPAPQPLPISSIIFGAKANDQLIDDIKAVFEGTDVLMKRSTKVPSQFEFGTELL